jgi:ubiquinone/menaquinone biosynthesis C-methylase UbiE
MGACYRNLSNAHFSPPEREKNNRIVDVGCGTGLMGIASDPFIGPDGKYVGIDVMKKDIDFCRRHYSLQHHEFFHLDINNPSYSTNQKNKKLNNPRL